MKAIWLRLWRWLRFFFAVVAAVVVGVLVWAGWLLSGQRYQQLLTEQLSALLDAQVRVQRSHVALRGGLGIGLESIAIQTRTENSPFFTAERIDFLLDFPSLWHGQLLFRRVDCVKPRIQVTDKAQSVTLLLERLRETQSKEENASGSWVGEWSSPSLALRHLTLHDAEIVYAQKASRRALVFTQTEAQLTVLPRQGLVVRVSTAVGQGERPVGRVSFRGTTPVGERIENLDKVEWKGEVELSEVRVQQVGRLLGAEWPQATIDLRGQYQGRWLGSIEFTGTLTTTDARIGPVWVHDGKAKITRLRWPGQTTSSVTMLSFLRTLIMEAQLEHLQGGVGETTLPVTLHKGELRLQGEELQLTGLTGMYGKESQITTATATWKRLFANNGPSLEISIVGDVDLEESGASLLSLASGAEDNSLTQHLTQLRGRALSQFRFQTATVARGAVNYDGEIILQQAGFHVTPWDVDVSDVNGSLRVSPESLATDTLTLKLGQSALGVQGRVLDYRGSRRRAELQLTFAELRDHDLVPLLPKGQLLPQGGTASGQLAVTIPPQGSKPQITGHATLNRVRLDLVNFLKPLEVEEGEISWQGQGGTFSVKNGRLPGGDFSGHGRVQSLEPLNLEVTAEFPSLNLESALAPDKPDDDSPKDATRVVRTDLKVGRLTYKTLQADDSHVSCYWHGRQADLTIAHATIEGGQMQGEAVLWPDIQGLFLAPQLTSVDVTRFLHALGTPTNALTGSLNGGGKIYMTDWHQWDAPAHWDALLSLNVVDGVAQRLPILVRLWSALSLQGLLSFHLPSLPTEGLAFSSLTGDVAFGKGVAVTNNLSLNGSAVRLDARGEIDLANHTVDLKTAIAPLHGITSSVAKVPLAGKLLASGADMLTSLTFHVSGPYHDPSVTPLLIDMGKR